jgi:hypothetical protein
VTLAELLGTPSKEDVQSDFEDLRKKFKPWREDHDDWDKMVFPDVDEDVVADRNRGRILSKAGEDRRMASQYRTNFVRVGVDNLINRLSRAEPKLETAISISRLAPRWSASAWVCSMFSTNNTQRQA